MRRWLARHSDERERAAYAQQRERRAQFVELVLRYRERLEAFYREPLPAEAKRAGKARLFAEMAADYSALKAERWGGWSGYDRWFERGVNNAQLASVATYEELVPAFRALLAQQDGDMARFYGAVRKLAQLDQGERDAALAALADNPMPPPAVVDAGRSGR